MAMSSPWTTMRSGSQCSSSNLIRWLKQCTSVDGLKINRLPRTGRGWGLVATHPLQPHELLLSMPWSCIVTAPEAPEELHPLSSMMPLAHVLAGKLSHRLPMPPQGEWCCSQDWPWIESLPSSVPLPWLYWNDEDILQLQDERILQEIASMRRHVAQMRQEHHNQDGCCDSKSSTLVRALSLVYSRAHTSNRELIIAPGIDTANHDFSPNCFVRTVHSPDACQGITALAEVAPLPPSASPHADPSANTSLFQLVVGEEGISAGDEVTISYGPWDNNRYLLHYGFVPDSNPHDKVTLFENNRELVRYAARHVGTSSLDYDFEKNMDSQVEEDGAVFMTTQGIDAQTLARMASVMEIAFGIRERQELCIPSLVSARCKDILNSYPTSLEEDLNMLQQLGSKCNDDFTLTTAVRFRISKKKVLSSAIRGIKFTC